LAARARWARIGSGINTSESRTRKAFSPGVALTWRASSRAMARVTSFSRLPVGPTAPGSWPPWPASMATISGRALAGLITGRGAGAGAGAGAATTAGAAVAVGTAVVADEVAMAGAGVLPAGVALATAWPVRPSRIACGEAAVAGAGAGAVAVAVAVAAGIVAGGVRPACTTCAVSNAVARAASARAAAGSAVTGAVEAAGAVATAVVAAGGEVDVEAAAGAGRAVAVAVAVAGPSPGHSISRRAPSAVGSVRTGSAATGADSSNTMR